MHNQYQVLSVSIATTTDLSVLILQMSWAGIAGILLMENDKHRSNNASARRIFVCILATCNYSCPSVGYPLKYGLSA